MATTVITSSKPETPVATLRELISSFVRKPAKPQPHGRDAHSERCRRESSSSAAGDAGYWGIEFSTDSFLELSSEVSPIDDETFGSSRDNFESDDVKSGVTENGNLWKDEVRRKCVQLTKSLEHQLRQAPVERHGLDLKIPTHLAQRIAKKIVNTASSEPCGLRGCCVYLRLLHEDVASVLMTSQREEQRGAFTKDRAERCASWPEAPANTRGMQYNVTSAGQCLDFRSLPDMDASLTKNFGSEYSTDSGYAESMDARRGSMRRIPHATSSSSIATLPKLSAASRLQVACADLGRLDLCDPDSVPTFEVYVYLAPSTSWTWWLRKFFSSSLKMNKEGRRTPENRGPIRTVTLVPDFTLVKRKLYRSRSNSLEVIRCPLLT